MVGQGRERESTVMPTTVTFPERADAMRDADEAVLKLRTAPGFAARIPGHRPQSRRGQRAVHGGGDHAVDEQLVGAGANLLAVLKRDLGRLFVRALDEPDMHAGWRQRAEVADLIQLYRTGAAAQGAHAIGLLVEPALEVVQAQRAPRLPAPGP